MAQIPMQQSETKQSVTFTPTFAKLVVNRCGNLLEISAVGVTSADNNKTFTLPSDVTIGSGNYAFSHLTGSGFIQLLENVVSIGGIGASAEYGTLVCILI